MLKLKLEVVFDEEELRDIFESYDKKFTKKKLAELKADLKENSAADDFAYSIKDELVNCIGEWIDNMFDDKE